MYHHFRENVKELRTFLILWGTQSFSSLGSSMTSLALVIWAYEQKGSALTTALLTICSYAPYVIFSIFAGSFIDRKNKKLIMLASDSLAAVCTVLVLILFSTGRLKIWHLYFLNTVNGLMNTLQQPAADVTVSLLTPNKYYQKVSGLRSLSNSFVTVLAPVLSTALLSFAGLRLVILFDLITFFTAFVSLLCFIKIPKIEPDKKQVGESLLDSVNGGLTYLKKERGILDLILFLAVINFTASIFNAALPPMMLSRTGGGKIELGMVNTAAGLATLAGSILVTLLPAPKSRVRVILNCLLFSMSTENFILALGRTTPVWCFGSVLGWILIPVMGANMDALLRTKIPVTMQGRVYSARNTLQFFTIPLGYLCGGILIDQVFEPLMAHQAPGSFLLQVFGSGKGSGAALLFFLIGITGALSCLPFRLDRHLWELEETN